jgi:hypothetical protein
MNVGPPPIILDIYGWRLGWLAPKHPLGFPTQVEPSLRSAITANQYTFCRVSVGTHMHVVYTFIHDMSPTRSTGCTCREAKPRIASCHHSPNNRHSSPIVSLRDFWSPPSPEVSPSTASARSHFSDCISRMRCSIVRDTVRRRTVTYQPSQPAPHAHQLTPCLVDKR